MAAEREADEIGWPADVHGITLSGMSKLGVRTRTHELYWDGEKIVTEKRFSTFVRVLAIVGLAFGGIGVIATVVQAWAALAALRQ